MAAYQKQQDNQVLAPPTMPRSDAENPNTRNYELDQIRNKKKKRTRCIAYIAIFAVLQLVVILIITLAIVRVKSPRLRLDRVVARPDPTGDLRFSARVVVRNRNFGRYKFDDTYATVRTSNGTNVGQFLIGERRVRARDTKKIAVLWDVRGTTNSSSGTVDLVVEAEMRGKVEVFRVIKRRKTAYLNCGITLHLPTNTVQNLSCN